MEYKDYYEILGADKKATNVDLKKKYRKLAQKYHPDRNPDNMEAEEKFKELQEAYEVLKDDDKRAKYDQLGHNWKQYQQAGASGFDFSQWANQGAGRQYRTSYDDIFGETGHSDFFESFFGGGFRGGGRKPRFRQAKGQDFEAQVTLNLSDAYHGTSTTLNLEGNKIKATLKPGVRNGQKLRVKGQGGPGGNGGPNGDLYLKINVVNNTLFELKENDLYLEQETDLFTAILGGKITINAMKGHMSIKLQEGTQNGKTMRLKGLGMPVFGKPGTFGDLYIKINVKLPEQLSEKEQELFRQLAALRK